MTDSTPFAIPGLMDIASPLYEEALLDLPPVTTTRIAGVVAGGPHTFSGIPAGAEVEIRRGGEILSPLKWSSAEEEDNQTVTVEADALTSGQWELVSTLGGAVVIRAFEVVRP